MLPNPLHAAVVHFPIVLAVLLPISAVVALYAIRRGTRPLVAWGIQAALVAALSVSAFVALKTGEAEEERVEAVVSEQALHAHEEAAERFLVVSAVLLVVAVFGVAGGVIGSSARLIATLGSVVVLLLGVQVGRAGGELVYKHGAASAYAHAANGEAETTSEGVAGEADSDLKAAK